MLFYVFRFHDLPVVSTANGSPEQESFVLSGLVRSVIYVRICFKGYISHS